MYSQIFSRWLPTNVSTFGGEIDAILSLIFWVVLPWFVLLHLLGFWFLFRYRRKSGRPAVYVKGNSFRQSAWILIPALIVLLLDIYIDIRSNRVWALIKESTPPAEIQVRITGKQFNWEMLHPGQDGILGSEDDFLVENDLHIPVNKVVHATLASKDVIHSFFLPELRLKQDAVPGREILIWFEATQPGRYTIACAELCGFGHSGMNGWLYVHTAEDYDKWVREHGREN